MKRIISSSIFTLSTLIVQNIALAADAGPYYISYDDFCDVYELYITPNLNVYGREIGCERESVVITGHYTADYNNPKLPLHFHSDGKEYVDVISLKTGYSYLFYTNGSSMEYIVDTKWNFSETKTRP